MNNKTCQNSKFVVKIKNYFPQSNSAFSDIRFKHKMQTYMNRDLRPTVYQVFKIVVNIAFIPRKYAYNGRN